MGDFSKACDKDTQTVTVDQWIYCESMMDAIMTSKPKDEIELENLSKAKDAVTVFKFKKLTKDGKHSIVKCYPKTGRTH